MRSRLKEDYGFDEVVAVLVDVGQDADMGPAVRRGERAGADEVVVVDRREAFADEQVAKALVANALYEGKYPLISALSGRSSPRRWRASRGTSAPRRWCTGAPARERPGALRPLSRRPTRACA